MERWEPKEWGTYASAKVAKDVKYFVNFHSILYQNQIFSCYLSLVILFYHADTSVTTEPTTPGGTTTTTVTTEPTTPGGTTITTETTNPTTPDCTTTEPTTTEQQEVQSLK